MSRNLALLATVFALAGAPALAATPPAPVTPSAATSPGKPAPPAPPRKATPQERVEAERLDPLARATFWAHEVDVDPRDADAGVKLAKALRALNRFEQAGAAADQVLVLDPKNYEALLESARAKIDAGQGFYAIDLIQRAQAMSPGDWRPVSLMAIALEQDHRGADALTAHQKALAMAPNNPATLSNLGMYYAQHGDAAKAEALLRKAAAAPGAGPQERQNLALVLGMEGRFDEAESLQRQDLPPEEVDNNLAYLRAAAAPAQPRSWQAVSQAQ